ncbi:MAG: WD40 repeat domain-containing protein [Candidatus Poribacteria bacterium]|nr:WD40 repeat domain-containing protein [Candidatus Poribacteria bacterium]
MEEWKIFASILPIFQIFSLMRTKRYHFIFTSIFFSMVALCGFADQPLSPIWSLEFSPDGKMLAIGKYQWVELWDLETQSIIHTYEPHAGEVRSLKFSEARHHDERERVTSQAATNDQKTSSLRLYAGGGVPAQSGEIRIWDVASEELIKSFEVHGDIIESIALSPNNATLLTASMDEYSAVIDVTRLEDTEDPIDTQAKWLTQHVGRVLCTLYHPQGTYFVTGSEDKTIKVWNPNTFNVMVNFDANDDAVYSLAYSVNESVIVSGSADNTVRTWRVTPAGDGEEVAVGRDSLEMTGDLVREYDGHQGAVYSVDAALVLPRRANNQTAMIASGSADTSVIIWNLRSGNRYSTFDESTDAVYAVKFSPNGEFVAAGGRDGKVRLWNLRRRALTHEF